MQETMSQEDCSGADTPCTRVINQQETNFAQLQIEGGCPSGGRPSYTRRDTRGWRSVYRMKLQWLRANLTRLRLSPR